MSEEYQTEDEQIDAIKRWWKENGKSIFLGLILGVGGIGGYRYWQSSVAEQAQLASEHFQEVVALSKDKKEKFLARVNEVTSKHAGESYADFSAFVAAKKLVDEKDFKAARKQLEWVIANSKYTSFIHIARIRLVKVLLQLNEPQAALDLIKDVKSSGFESAYAELRGDIYASLNMNTKAKAEYQVALNKINAGDRHASTIEMKSNNLPATDAPLTSAVKEK